MSRKIAWLLANLLAATLALSGCRNMPVVQPSPEAYATPPADVIEKAQSRVTLAGRILADKEGNVWLLTQDTFKQLSSGGRARQPAWSPDGQRIAYVRMGDNSSDIWVMNADGSGARALTKFSSANIKANHWAFDPAWSPEGGRIAYLSEQASFDLALWVMDADGSNPRQIAVLDAYTGGVGAPSWAPDNTRMAYAAYRNGVPQIWSMLFRTGEWTQLSKNAGGAYDAAWSPTGTHIAYTARDNGKNDIWVMAEDGSIPTKVTTTGFCRAPAWSADGTTLAYLNGAGGYFDLWQVKITVQNGAIKVGDAEQVTKNAQLDPASGIAWTR